jgi:hypothetical protein
VAAQVAVVVVESVAAAVLAEVTVSEAAEVAAAEAVCLLSIAARLQEVFQEAVREVPVAVPSFAWANQTVEDRVVADQEAVVARSNREQTYSLRSSHLSSLRDSHLRKYSSSNRFNNYNSNLCRHRLTT